MIKREGMSSINLGEGGWVQNPHVISHLLTEKIHYYVPQNVLTDQETGNLQRFLNVYDENRISVQKMRTICNVGS